MPFEALTSPALLSRGERREKSKTMILLCPSLPLGERGRGVRASQGMPLINRGVFMKRFFTISVLLLAAAPVLATTMVLGTDEDLYGQAELIVEGTVLAVVPSPSGLPATAYRVRVDR